MTVAAGEQVVLTPGAVEANAEEEGDTTWTLDAAVDGNGLEIIFPLIVAVAILLRWRSGSVTLVRYPDSWRRTVEYSVQLNTVAGLFSRSPRRDAERGAWDADGTDDVDDVDDVDKTP